MIPVSVLFPRPSNTPQNVWNMDAKIVRVLALKTYFDESLRYSSGHYRNFKIGMLLKYMIIGNIMSTMIAIRNESTNSCAASDVFF